MKRFDHLMVCLNEEAVELAQRVDKVLRFGLDDIQEGQPLTNRERLMQELIDFHAVLVMVQNEGALPGFANVPDFYPRVHAKLAKVEQFLTTHGRAGGSNELSALRQVDNYGSKRSCMPRRSSARAGSACIS